MKAGGLEDKTIGWLWGVGPCVLSNKQRTTQSNKGETPEKGKKNGPDLPSRAQIRVRFLVAFVLLPPKSNFNRTRHIQEHVEKVVFRYP